MSKSPGHRKWPDHHVRETHVPERMQARIAGQVLADSRDVIRVDEDEHLARYYFPRNDVNFAALEWTSTTTECPFKGKAKYFSVHANGGTLPDAAWTYETPYEEHADLKERIAFYEDKYPEIEVSVV